MCAESGTTGPLPTEHRALQVRFAYLVHNADQAATAGGAEMRPAVQELLGFLVDHLQAHTRAEEQLLYPELERYTGDTLAVAVLRHQHAEVARLTRRLAELAGQLPAGPLSPGQKCELRRTLYGLSAVLLLHLNTEEDLFLPILDDRLDRVNAAALFHRMNATAVAESGGRCGGTPISEVGIREPVPAATADH